MTSYDVTIITWSDVSVWISTPTKTNLGLLVFKLLRGVFHVAVFISFLITIVDYRLLLKKTPRSSTVQYLPLWAINEPTSHEITSRPGNIIAGTKLTKQLGTPRLASHIHDVISRQQCLWHQIPTTSLTLLEVRHLHTIWHLSLNLTQFEGLHASHLQGNRLGSKAAGMERPEFPQSGILRS